jgi:hypothetical protein
MRIFFKWLQKGQKRSHLTAQLYYGAGLNREDFSYIHIEESDDT